MKGHEDIITMRRNRMAPAFVFINDWPCKTDWMRERAAATVCTDGDVIQSLDLRFLVGLQVVVSSTDERRAKALFEACKAAGAKAVASCHIKDGVPGWKQDGWFQVWRKEAA